MGAERVRRSCSASSPRCRGTKPRSTKRNVRATKKTTKPMAASYKAKQPPKAPSGKTRLRMTQGQAEEARRPGSGGQSPGGDRQTEVHQGDGRSDGVQGLEEVPGGQDAERNLVSVTLRELRTKGSEARFKVDQGWFAWKEMRKDVAEAYPRGSSDPFLVLAHNVPSWGVFFLVEVSGTRPTRFFQTRTRTVESRDFLPQQRPGPSQSSWTVAGRAQLLFRVISLLVERALGVDGARGELRFSKAPGRRDAFPPSLPGSTKAEGRR